jgi:hypothetical protein
LLSIANHNSAKSATAMITILTVMPKALESASGIGACCACADESLMSAPRSSTTDWVRTSTIATANERPAVRPVNRSRTGHPI